MSNWLLPAALPLLLLLLKGRIFFLSNVYRFKLRCSYSGPESQLQVLLPFPPCLACKPAQIQPQTSLSHTMERASNCCANGDGRLPSALTARNSSPAQAPVAALPCQSVKKYERNVCSKIEIQCMSSSFTPGAIYWISILEHSIVRVKVTTISLPGRASPSEGTKQVLPTQQRALASPTHLRGVGGGEAA